MHWLVWVYVCGALLPVAAGLSTCLVRVQGYPLAVSAVIRFLLLIGLGLIWPVSIPYVMRYHRSKGSSPCE